MLRSVSVSCVRRPNASSPVEFPRQYEPVSWGFTAVQDQATKKYHAFVDTGCYTPCAAFPNPLLCYLLSL